MDITKTIQTTSAPARTGLADMLEALADGESVRLGEFSDAGSGATDADEQAELLRDLATLIRP